MIVSIFRVKGIHCGSCISRIERKAMSLGAYMVSFEIKEMILRVYQEVKIDDLKLKKDIESMNYLVDFLASYDEDEIS